MPRSRSVPWLVLCLSLLIAAVACGSGDEDDDSSSTSTTEASGSTTTADADGSTTTAPTGGTQQVSPDPSEPIDLAVGATVTLDLEANPTTGYSWEITIADEAVVEKVGDTYEATSSGMVGSGGRQLIELEGVAAGETTVEAVYLRPFEPDQPAQTETWTVRVTG
jgi:inhibitor of cysteine peptidase